jgi:hypothetical protein
MIARSRSVEPQLELQLVLNGDSVLADEPTPRH